MPPAPLQRGAIFFFLLLLTDKTAINPPYLFDFTDLILFAIGNNFHAGTGGGAGLGPLFIPIILARWRLCC